MVFWALYCSHCDKYFDEFFNELPSIEDKTTGHNLVFNRKFPQPVGRLVQKPIMNVQDAVIYMLMKTEQLKLTKRI